MGKRSADIANYSTHGLRTIFTTIHAYFIGKVGKATSVNETCRNCFFHPKSPNIYLLCAQHLKHWQSGQTEDQEVLPSSFSLLRASDWFFFMFPDCRQQNVVPPDSINIAIDQSVFFVRVRNWGLLTTKTRKQWEFLALPTSSGSILHVLVAFTQRTRVSLSFARRALVPLTVFLCPSSLQTYVRVGKAQQKISVSSMLKIFDALKRCNLSRIA